MILGVSSVICSYFCTALMNAVTSEDFWTDYEDAKSFFLEMMMTAEGEEHERAECVYIQLLHGLDECSDADE